MFGGQLYRHLDVRMVSQVLSGWVFPGVRRVALTMNRNLVSKRAQIGQCPTQREVVLCGERVRLIILGAETNLTHGLDAYRPPD